MNIVTRVEQYRKINYTYIYSTVCMYVYPADDTAAMRGNMCKDQFNVNKQNLPKEIAILGPAVGLYG